MKEKIKNDYATKNGFDNWEDLLCNALPDFVRFAINEVMEIYVNLEVEKRIAERMPSEDELESVLPVELINIEKILIPGMSEGRKRAEVVRHHDANRFRREGINWLRSRLTPQVTPQDTPQDQKTEGGGE